LAAIRDVWQMFVAMLPKMVTPGSDITVDERIALATFERAHLVLVVVLHVAR